MEGFQYVGALTGAIIGFEIKWLSYGLAGRMSPFIPA
jgi:hypothetical protein